MPGIQAAVAPHPGSSTMPCSTTAQLLCCQSAQLHKCTACLPVCVPALLTTNQSVGSPLATLSHLLLLPIGTLKCLVQPNVHFSAVCTSSSEVADASAPDKLRSACSEREHCSHVEVDCGYVVHVANMNGVRLKASDVAESNLSLTPIEPADWLWMLGKA